METEKAILIILLGGVLGVVGQGVRMMVGLKKLNESNENPERGATLEFDANRIWLSLFMGFVAGILSVIVKGIDEKFVYTKEVAFAIIAAGYSGADFIEGVFNSYIKKDVTKKDEANPNPSPENKPAEPEKPTE